MCGNFTQCTSKIAMKTDYRRVWINKIQISCVTSNLDCSHTTAASAVVPQDEWYMYVHSSVNSARVHSSPGDDDYIIPYHPPPTACLYQSRTTQSDRHTMGPSGTPHHPLSTLLSDCVVATVRDPPAEMSSLHNLLCQEELRLNEGSEVGVVTVAHSSVEAEVSGGQQDLWVPWCRLPWDCWDSRLAGSQ